MVTAWIKKILIVLLIHFLGGSVHTLWALDANKLLTQYKLDKWSIERGLDQNTIFFIQQSYDGYLWLGTLDGLVRFDGVLFKVFNKQNTSAFKSSEIRFLYEDRNHILWIGIAEGLVQLINGEFRPYPIKGIFHFNDIRSIGGDKNRTLWIITKDGLIAPLERETVKPFANEKWLGQNARSSFTEDKEGNFWIGCGSSVVLRKTSGKMVIFSKESGLICNYIYTICARQMGEIWLGTNNGLYQYQPAKQTFVRYGLEDGLPNIQVVCLYEDKRQCMWVGLDGGGVIRYKNGQFNTLSTSQGLASGYVYSICEDREGSIWLGTVEGGLHRLGDTPFTPFTTTEGLLDNYVYNVEGNADGEVFIRTERGINCLKNGQFRYIKKSSKGYYVLEVDEAGGLWFDEKAGIEYIQNHKIQLLSSPHLLVSNDITQIVSDRVGSLWIGTKKGVWHYSQGKFTKLLVPKELIDTIITVLYLDRENSLWIGTEKGTIFKLHQGYCTQLTPRDIFTDGRPIECILKDKKGILYIGSRVGLHRLANGKSTLFTTHHGLMDNFVATIFEDNAENIWIGGRTGISRISKKELEAVACGQAKEIKPLTFNEEDGMKSRWCQSMGLKNRDGKLWFPTIKGVVLVDPAKLKKNTLPPPVIIEELKVDGDAIKTKYILTQMKKNQPIVIPPGKKRLEFFYTAPSFIKPRKIQFKLKLEGFDKEWISVGNTRSNTYTALPPGHYTLRVIACNSDGVWNNQGAALAFYMTPYFYQTTWFYVLVSCFVGLLIFSAYQFRVRQLKAKEKELSRLVALRTHALNERTNQLEIAHQKLHLSHQIIQEKNQHILASIQYARKIQQALLPDDLRFKSIIDDYFILFKPRDIVSGDFYWFSQKEERYFIAVVDCTGHGVPGALLSMIGNTKLNEIIEEMTNPNPASLLLKLHLGVRQALKQESDDSQNNDGMDVALCMIDPAEATITFAGARRTLYYVQNNELLEIKGSRYTIGGTNSEKLPVYTNHTIPLNIDTILYITSDGFADQNNPQNKKYGSPQLKKQLLLISSLSMPAQKQALEDELNSFRNNEEQRDDITIIGLQIKPNP